MKKAIGYMRVSTPGQAEEGVSLDAQRKRIEAWAKGQGFELMAVHKDAGISGGKVKNRPGLQQAIEETCKNGAALVVYSLSRMARSTRDALDISERLDKAGADLVSLSEQIDTTSAAGKMVFRMLAVLAEFERDLVSERTKAALAYLRSQGRKTGNVPFGFDDVDGNLVPNREEKKIILRIVRLHRRGLSLRKIGAKLEALGIRTKSGSKRWGAQVISNILKRAVA